MIYQKIRIMVRTSVTSITHLQNLSVWYVLDAFYGIHSKSKNRHFYLAFMIISFKITKITYLVSISYERYINNNYKWSSKTFIIIIFRSTNRSQKKLFCIQIVYWNIDKGEKCWFPIVKKLIIFRDTQFNICWDAIRIDNSCF